MMQDQKKQLYLFVGLLTAFKLIIHLIYNTGYGYFRDEFYYIECANRLAWGYVDHPPLAMLITRISLDLLGDSLTAIRFLPALAGAGIVAAGGMIVIMLGGGRYAVFATGIGLIVAPVLLIVGNYASMNVYDQLIITLWIYFVIRLFKDENGNNWYLIALLTGLALLNKYTLLFYLFFVLLMMLAGSERRFLKMKQFRYGLIIVVVMLLPHGVWQLLNDFPTVEFMRNAALYKNAELSIGAFLSEVMLEQNPFNVGVIFIAGILMLADKDMQRYKTLLLAFLLVLLFFAFTNGKPYYLASYMGGILALSSVVVERALKTAKLRMTGYSQISLLIISGIILVPFALPVLSPKKFIEYTNMIGIKPSASENNEQGPLPQHYADMFGWEELTEAVRTAFNQLSEKEKTQAVIFAQNYGEAGAISLLGKKYGLPPVISGHNNYYLWGPNKDKISVVIIIGGGENELYFDSIVKVSVSDHPYAMPYERNLPVYIGRGYKFDIQKVWYQLKNYN